MQKFKLRSAKHKSWMRRQLRLLQLLPMLPQQWNLQKQWASGRKGVPNPRVSPMKALRSVRSVV